MATVTKLGLGGWPAGRIGLVLDVGATGSAQAAGTDGGGLTALAFLTAPVRAAVLASAIGILYAQAEAGAVAWDRATAKKILKAATSLLAFIPNGKDPVAIHRAFERLLKIVGNLQTRVDTLEAAE